MEFSTFTAASNGAALAASNAEGRLYVLDRGRRMEYWARVFPWMSIAGVCRLVAKLEAAESRNREDAARERRAAG